MAEAPEKKAKAEGKAGATLDGDHGDVSSESSDDDSLVLEGTIVRNPDVSSSSSDDDEDNEEEEKSPPKNGRADNGQPTLNSRNQKKRKRERKQKRESGPDVTEVSFTFCDMNDKFFHGIKTLLHSSSTLYAAQSSPLSDLMIENVSVGTVISTEDDEEGNVFGFASVVNLTSNRDNASIRYLKEQCLASCPDQNKKELEVVLSGKTKRPAGFLFHSRMVNLPLELVLVLHEQLVLDMDWAVDNAEGGEEERQSLNFGAFVRLAPAYPSNQQQMDYKYFDDEIFAMNAEFTYTMNAPKSYGSDVKQMIVVIVMTKTGHRTAMQEMKRMIGTK